MLKTKCIIDTTDNKVIYIFGDYNIEDFSYNEFLKKFRNIYYNKNDIISDEEFNNLSKDEKDKIIKKHYKKYNKGLL